MLRSILGAVVGYVVMAIVVMAAIYLLWVVTGPTGAFAGEGPAPSTLWLVCDLVFAFVAAVIGGCVALKVGRSSTAVHLLAGLVVVLGILLAVGADAAYEEREPVDKPVAEMSFREAGEYAVRPGWYDWSIPFVGAAGVLLGGRRWKSSG